MRVEQQLQSCSMDEPWLRNILASARARVRGRGLPSLLEHSGPRLEALSEFLWTPAENGNAHIDWSILLSAREHKGLSVRTRRGRASKLAVSLGEA